MTLPLDGCSIAAAGTIPNFSQKIIQKRLEAAGASFMKTVTSTTDALIATEITVENSSAKVKAAIQHGVPIVTIDWMVACETSNSKVDESAYLVSPAAPAPAPATKTSTKASKRPASPSASPPPQPPKKAKKSESSKLIANVGEGQLAKSGTIYVPLDETCPLGSYRVYIDEDGMIYDASLNQTNASANNNKFYRIQLLCNAAGDFQTWTRWGRVGERGLNATLGNGSLGDAMSQFEKKFKAKSGLNWDARGDKPKAGKYAYVERSYVPDSDVDDDASDDDAEVKEVKEARRKSVQCSLDPPTRKLMELIFNQRYFDQAMSDLNYDADKLPLGKLSKAMINRGFQALKDLAALLQDNSLAETDYELSVAEAIEHLSNSYYSLIPHAFGRNRPPVIRSNDLLKREIELLESLGDMKEAAAMMKSSLKDDGDVHPLDRQFQGLGMDEMEALDAGSLEFSELSNYLNNSKGGTHRVTYQVQDIFRIQRHGEEDRFKKSPYSKIDSDRRLLWHGSRVTNFGGILGQGLRIAPPEAPVSGYMFGKGIYLADMSSKSAGYCSADSSGGTALLLLCEAELGNPMQELNDASYTAGEDAKAHGMHSTFGRGQEGPSRWKDAGCLDPSLAGVMMPDVSVKPGPTNIKGASLYYNEYICYDVAQVRLRYLLRVKM